MWSPITKNHTSRQQHQKVEKTSKSTKFPNERKKCQKGPKRASTENLQVKFGIGQNTVIIAAFQHQRDGTKFQKYQSTKIPNERQTHPNEPEKHPNQHLAPSPPNRKVSRVTNATRSPCVEMCSLAAGTCTNSLGPVHPDQVLVRRPRVPNERLNGQNGPNVGRRVQLSLPCVPQMTQVQQRGEI